MPGDGRADPVGRDLTACARAVDRKAINQAALPGAQGAAASSLMRERDERCHIVRGDTQVPAGSDAPDVLTGPRPSRLSHIGRLLAQGASRPGPAVSSTHPHEGARASSSGRPRALLRAHIPPPPAHGCVRTLPASRDAPAVTALTHPI